MNCCGETKRTVLIFSKNFELETKSNLFLIDNIRRLTSDVDELFISYVKYFIQPVDAKCA